MPGDLFRGSAQGAIQFRLIIGFEVSLVIMVACPPSIAPRGHPSAARHVGWPGSIRQYFAERCRGSPYSPGKNPLSFRVRVSGDISSVSAYWATHPATLPHSDA